ncbi:Nucleolar transcription factor 1 [Plecturocebus cupreus]
MLKIHKGGEGLSGEVVISALIKKKKKKKKKKLKWIHEAPGAVEVVQGDHVTYIQERPELNITEEGPTKSTPTKAEHQLKDNCDGRPTNLAPNSYSLCCAELMANMKDGPARAHDAVPPAVEAALPEEERLSLAKRKDDEVELLCFLRSLPQEERQQILWEERALNINEKQATAWPPRASPGRGKGSL